MIAIILLVVLTGALSAADSIRGTVVDPHERPTADAAIVVVCAERTGVAVSDESGRFQVAIDATGTCEVRVSRPGFETLTESIVVPVRAPLVFKLSPARWEERVEVTASVSTPAHTAIEGLGAAAVTADALRVAGPDPTRWLMLAERSAGQPLGSRMLAVNGMPASVLPPADAITSITVAADPFSVDVGGADRVMIDVASDAPRRWRVDFSPGLLASRQHDVLLTDASFESQQRTIGAGGPLTKDGAIRAQVSASTSSARSRAAYVEHGAAGDRLAVAGDTVDDGALVAGSIVARRGQWEWQGSLFTARSTTTNGGIGGRSGPSGALDVDASIDHEQVTWRRAGRRIVFRGGAALDRERRDSRSTASGAGYVVADALVAGGPDTLATSYRRSAFDVRAIAASREAPIRGWLAGVEAAAEDLEERRAFNPAGVVFAAAPSALAGPRLVRMGQPTADATTHRLAAFGQRVVAANPRLWARAGARVEWQRGYGVIVSPRLSVGVQAAGFFIGGNAGTFADLWAASDEIERAFRLSAPAVVDDGTARLPIVFDGAGERRTDTVLRASLTRPIGRARLGVEQTLRTGAHLSGLTRRFDADRLIDTMDHARSLVRRQTRVRLDLVPRHWNASAFYEYTASADDTDGAFWLGAGSDRGPSSGIPAHAVTGTAGGSVRGMRFLVTGRMTSGTPYSLLSGEDPDGMFAFNGRAGSERNLQRTPASTDLSAFVARRVRVPIARLDLDLGVRLENLLGTLTPLEVERSAASGLAGQAVRGARGRSISFWSTWGVR